MIRVASVKDAEQILKIYAPYVEKTAITFEYEVPALTEFRKRIENTLKKYPYIVVEKENEILGYAYAGPFVGRAAFDWSVEVTVYVREDQKKQGLGKKLYLELERLLKEQGITNLYACIAVPEVEDEYLTKNSVEFHRYLGYQTVGEFCRCGYKFERWYGIVWMEKIIGPHKEKMSPIVPFFQRKEDSIY